MAELRIPLKEEKDYIKKYFECLEKGCFYCEALINVTYSGFKEVKNIRVRCTKSNILLNEKHKICGGFLEN